MKQQAKAKDGSSASAIFLAAAVLVPNWILNRAKPPSQMTRSGQARRVWLFQG
ncbi:MAG TPA: hypothetical protein PK490_04855 [Prosthecobacter sp.]|nr:hypothetical protein [Prosthecobacter sp.]HRK13592.1 hypothetical protein [Prosthecobacter sp.]